MKCFFPIVVPNRRFFLSFHWCRRDQLNEVLCSCKKTVEKKVDMLLSCCCYFHRRGKKKLGVIKKEKNNTVLFLQWHPPHFLAFSYLVPKLPFVVITSCHPFAFRQVMSLFRSFFLFYFELPDNKVFFNTFVMIDAFLSSCIGYILRHVNRFRVAGQFTFVITLRHRVLTALW